MRIGQKPKKGRHWKTAGQKTNGKPQNVVGETVIGRISSDWIGDVFRYQFLERATQSLEQYAEALVAAQDNHQLEESEVQIDGTTTNNNNSQRPSPPLFDSQFRIDEFARIVEDTAQHFHANGGWKIHANAARFERSLDEKYGIFRPFIAQYPQAEQWIRTVQRNYAMGAYSPFRSELPLPRTTSVVLLFMMHRGGLSHQILGLAALFFLVGLQPWALIGLLMVFHTIQSRRMSRRVGGMPSRIRPGKSYYHTDHDNETVEEALKRKRGLLLEPVGTPFSTTTSGSSNQKQFDTTPYDALVIGVGSGCLYTAALLSRAGRKVLVLCPQKDAADVEVVQGVPVDLEPLNMVRVTKQQAFLAPALCTEHDCQGGIRFAQIGTPADGHAFQILSIPGVGTDKHTDQIPFVLKADGGKHALMHDAAVFLGDGWPASDGSTGDSSTGGFITALEGINAAAGEYYLSKILSETVFKYKAASQYNNVAVQYAESILNQFFPLNAHVRSLMAGIGLANENLRPRQASMGVHVTNICGALSGEGMHYPIGGGRALGHALANTVEEGGGRILTNVSIKELVFEEAEANVNEASPPAKPSCVGVRLQDETEIRFDPARFTESKKKPVIISMLSFMDTFLRMFPANIRNKYGCPQGLPALAEQRPVVKIAFAIKGDAAELDLHGADYYRLPGAARALDEVESESGKIKYGEIGWEDEDEHKAAAPGTLASENNTRLSGADRKRRKSPQKKFQPGVSWIHIAFPSAKDPSFATYHKGVSTCLVTVEGDDEVVQDMGTTPRLFQPKKNAAECLKKLQKDVEKDLYQIYPQLEGKLFSGRIIGPRHRGLSHTPERYAAKGVRADTPYKNLYYGGSDLTVGESFSAAVVAGWLAANAVMDYSFIDHLFFQKNITTDLARFIDSSGADDDDVAVPFTQMSEEKSKED